MTSTYEDEQDRLRRQLGIESDEEDDDVVLNFGVPDINPEIYRDVEPVLFQGFLTQSARINGVSFVFKSLNHHEFVRLNLLYNLRDGGTQDIQDYYNAFLSYGVLFVDNTNILEDRSSYVVELQEFFQGLDREAKQKVIRHLSEVNRRSSKAMVLTEAYCMETSSRMRWAQLKGIDLSSPTITGFPGTEKLGLNWGQLLWRAINYYEDQKENAEREWENSKFIASSMAGKGMQKIYSADKRRRQSDLEDKVKRRERIIRHALLNTPLEEGSAESGNIHVARTVSELATQLEKDLKGEQDWHDRVIAEHEARMRQGYETRLDHLRQLREDHIEKFGDRAVIAGPQEKGLSRTEVERHLIERQEKNARSLAARSRFPELFDPKYAELANKWMGQEPIIQQPPSVVMSPNPNRPRSKPFNGGKR